MLKKFKESKVYKYEVEDVVCDLCGTRIRSKVPFIRISVAACHSNDPTTGVVRPRLSDEHIDVCSTKCLKKNIGGVMLPLDTSMLPKGVEEPAQKVGNVTLGNVTTTDTTFTISDTTSIPLGTVGFDKTSNQIVVATNAKK